MKEIKNIHEGHRKRLKDKYIKGGLDVLEDHEVLELLLFYCYKRMDVNSKAHYILSMFSGLDNLFESSPQEIVNHCNVSMNTAILISLIPHLTRRYLNCKYKKGKAILSTKDAGDLAISLLLGRTEETFFVVCLDVNSRLIFAEMVATGTINEVTIYMRNIVSVVLKHNAGRIMLAHNHPSGDPYPSIADIETTKKVIEVMDKLDIDFLDHIIVGIDYYYSFSEQQSVKLR